MGGLGLPEIIIIAVVAIFIFGPKKLPELGAGLGKSIRDFKAAMSGKDSPDEDARKESEKKEPETKDANK
ncbi:MAG TPA: twin-arginine translocase TatA/TatE family subunit [Terriglobia bacterium]|nr:twin-arginine translocase TatA/TatE family subunit [Terriglobia bacterium]